jgi:hypothetical protein
MKIGKYILWFFLTLAVIIEYTYSVFHTIVEAIGLKINEGVNALEAAYQKAKS